MFTIATKKSTKKSNSRPKGLYKETEHGKRVHTHIFERVIQVFMLLFGALAVVIAYLGVRYDALSTDISLVLMMIILVLLILAQTVVMVKIYEKVE